MAEEQKLGMYRLVYDSEAKEWVIYRDGSERASRRVKTKDEAVKILNELSTNQEVAIAAVHKKDGKRQKKANCGAKKS